MLNTLIMIFYYGYLSSSWNILAGYTGQFSFGHSAFVGLGAYSVALLYTRYGISPWIGMLIGAAISAVASLGIGLPSLRLKKHYFILITVAFGQIMWITFLNWRELAGGATGITYNVLPFSWIDFQFNADRRVYYYIMLLLLALIVVLIYKLRTSKHGYYFTAIREDEIAAQTCGINIVKYKLLSATLSAILTSIGGSFYAQYVLYVEPDPVFNLELMTRIFLPSALGGLGTIMGPTIGAFILIPMSEYIRAYFGYFQGLHLVIYGVILIIVSVAMPAGIVGTLFGRNGIKISKYRGIFSFKDWNFVGKMRTRIINLKKNDFF